MWYGIGFIIALFTPLLDPIHEAGHMLCDWLSFNPAIMGWSATYSVKYTFIGTLGGPVFDVAVPTVLVRIFAKREKKCVVQFFVGVIGGSILRTLLAGIMPNADNDFGIILRYWGEWYVVAMTIFIAVSIFSLFYVAYEITKMNELTKQKKKEYHRYSYREKLTENRRLPVDF